MAVGHCSQSVPRKTLGNSQEHRCGCWSLLTVSPTENSWEQSGTQTGVAVGHCSQSVSPTENTWKQSGTQVWLLVTAHSQSHGKQLGTVRYTDRCGCWSLLTVSQSHGKQLGTVRNTGVAVGHCSQSVSPTENSWEQSGTQVWLLVTAHSQSVPRKTLGNSQVHRCGCWSLLTVSQSHGKQLGTVRNTGVVVGHCSQSVSPTENTWEQSGTQVWLLVTAHSQSVPRKTVGNSQEHRCGCWSLLTVSQSHRKQLGTVRYTDRCGCWSLLTVSQSHGKHLGTVRNTGVAVGHCSQSVSPTENTWEQSGTQVWLLVAAHSQSVPRKTVGNSQEHRCGCWSLLTVSQSHGKHLGTVRNTGVVVGHCSQSVSPTENSWEQSGTQVWLLVTAHSQSVPQKTVGNSQVHRQVWLLVTAHSQSVPRKTVGNSQEHRCGCWSLLTVSPTENSWEQSGT